MNTTTKNPALLLEKLGFENELGVNNITTACQRKWFIKKWEGVMNSQNLKVAQLHSIAMQPCNFDATHAKNQ